MQLKMHMNADPERLFDCIVESVAYDASESKGKKVAPEKIRKGYSYSKVLRTKVGKNSRTKVTIEELDRPSSYVARFEAPGTTTEIGYALSPSGEGTDLVYRERLITDSHFASANYKLMSFLYSWRAKKRARTMLRGMESYIRATTHEEE